MGYGGSREDAGKAVGRSGDGGIDGIINEDRLGLDVIYVQAKRWEGNVGAPEIAGFAGALAGKSANKGIFITTSDFTRAAKEFVAAGFKIILINGNQLAEYSVTSKLIGYIDWICWVSLRSTQPTNCQSNPDRLRVYD